MIGKGIYEVDVDGKTIGFEFGMLASSYTEEISGLSIFEVFKKIGTGRSQMSILHYFYGAARAYNEFRELAGTVTIQKVSKAIEEIGLAKSTEIYVKSIESYIPKNGQAPKVTGQEVV